MSRRKLVWVDRVLVYYDGPQVFTALGARHRRYIFVAVPGGKYFGSSVSEQAIDEYLSERSDLLYLIKSAADKNYYLISPTIDNPGRDERFAVEKVDRSNVLADWWPDRGFFASAHTEPEPQLDSTQESTGLLNIRLDGRWDASDLGHFPDALVDAYSFAFAVRDERDGTRPQRKRAFSTYPWRGGFSAVGFFNSLYSNIPRTERLRVQEIHYASPGHIRFSALESVVKMVQDSVIELTDNYDVVRSAYRELHVGMSTRKLLGRSRAEVQPTDNDLQWVEALSKGLAQSMKFDYAIVVADLASDWITAAKILMSYYRRIAALADFYSSGKATYEGLGQPSLIA